MSQYCRFEVLAGSLFVGVLEFFVALTIATDNASEPLHTTLSVIGADDVVALVLGLVACLTVYGSVRPHRNTRHIGLALSAMALLAVFVLLLGGGTYSFSAGVVFVLALSALGMYAADAHLHVIEQRRLHAQGP